MNTQLQLEEFQSMGIPWYKILPNFCVGEYEEGTMRYMKWETWERTEEIGSVAINFLSS